MSSSASSPGPQKAPPPESAGVWWSAATTPPLLVAPMAEFTDAPMRLVAGRFGAAFCHTEMVNARALADGVHASLRLLATLPGEPPCAAHLYGDRPEDFAAAAERVEALGAFASIDINCGCPVERIRACGAGSALMGQPALVRRIVEAVRAHCSLPVTIKTRLGPAPDAPLTAPDLLRAAADGGASAAVLHARYISQFNTGPVDAAALAAVVASSPLPVAANGGIRSGADALRLVRESGARAAAIGWAAVGNPWLVEAVAASLGEGRPVERRNPAPGEIRTLLAEHLALCRVHRERQVRRWPDVRSRLTDEEALSLDFRHRLFRYLAGVPGASRFRAHLATYRTDADIRRALDELLAEGEGGHG